MKLRYICLFPLFCFACCVLFAQQSEEQMASYYLRTGEYDKAIEMYKPLYERTHNKYYYQMLLQAYQKVGMNKEAMKLVERCIKQYPKDLSYWVDLGILQEKQGDTKKARKSFHSALDKVGADVKQNNNLALAFENAGLLDYAVDVYLTSRQKTNNSLGYIMELATLYQKQKAYDKMCAEYIALIDLQTAQMTNVQLALQRALDESTDDALSEGLKKALVRKVRENPENQAYMEMMIWYSLQVKDFNFAFTQAKAADARFPDVGVGQVLRVAQIAYSNEAFELSSKAYKYLINKGKETPFYFDSRVGELLSKQGLMGSNLSGKQLTALEQEYKDAIVELGKNLQTVPLMRNYAHLLAYQDNHIQEAADLLYDVLELPRLPQAVYDEVKLELGDLLLFSGEIWDASLLYSQVEKSNKNDILGSQAKYKNALLSYYNQDFDWAKSQFDVLRSSTSKLVANDAMEMSLLISNNMDDDSTYSFLSYYAQGDLFLYRHQLDSAVRYYDEVFSHALSHPLFDEVLFQEAKIAIERKSYEEADSLLNRIITHYGSDILADDALFLRAQLNRDYLGRIDIAKECYESIILDYSDSLFVDRSRKQLAILDEK